MCRMPAYVSHTRALYPHGVIAVINAELELATVGVYLIVPPTALVTPPPSPVQAKALYAALSQWNTLEVSVGVDRTIVTRLLSRSGRILAGISSNMGITLLVEREKGVLRGRARTEEDAKEANRVLKLKV